MVKVFVVIPCHNQSDIVSQCLIKLKKQTRVPDGIIVVDDHSDTVPMFADMGNVHIVQTDTKGRSSARNTGIKVAYELGADVTIMIDGDTVPESILFVERHMEQHRLGGKTIAYGMRRHVPRPTYVSNYNTFLDYEYQKIERYPSDLLTGNMDNLALGKPMDYRDLRLLSGTVKAWEASRSFDEKCDLLLSGMVTWSCNFSMSRGAVEALRAFMQSSYNVEGWFDDTTFNDGWGYEDVAMGLDAHFAGIEIVMDANSIVHHLMHDRSDNLDAHIKGRHRIMHRYRKLLQTPRSPGMDTWSRLDAVMLASGTAVGLTKREVIIDGRMFIIPGHVRGVRDRNSLLQFRGKLYINGFLFDHVSGSFQESLLGKVLDFFQ